MIEPDGRDELGMDDRVSGATRWPWVSSEDSTYTRGEPTRGNREADLDSDVLAAEFTHVTVPTASSSKQHDVLSPAPRVHFFRVTKICPRMLERSGSIYQAVSINDASPGPDHPARTTRIYQPLSLSFPANFLHLFQFLTSF